MFNREDPVNLGNRAGWQLTLVAMLAAIGVSFLLAMLGFLNIAVFIFRLAELAFILVLAKDFWRRTPSRFHSNQSVQPGSRSSCRSYLPWDEDLSDEGNAFAESYYGAGGAAGLYFDDYRDVLERDVPGTYYVEDTWANFDKLATVIDRRYAEWKAGPPKRKKFLGLF